MVSSSKARKPSAEEIDAVLPNDFLFILQRFPDLVAYQKTTCRHPFCPAPDHASQPATYRISIEKTSNLQKGNKFCRTIPLTPKYPWSGALKYGPYAAPKRGLGEGVEAWWCLGCLESVWLQEKGFIRRGGVAKRPEDPELWEQLLRVRLEKRTAGINDLLYHLTGPQRFAVEKWRAIEQYRIRKQYDDEMETGNVFGNEPMTLYESAAIRNMDSIDKATGRTVTIRAADAQDKKLSEVLSIMDAKVERLHRALAPPKKLIVKFHLGKRIAEATTMEHAVLQKKAKLGENLGENHTAEEVAKGGKWVPEK